jgi:hypothetical protein
VRSLLNPQKQRAGKNDRQRFTFLIHLQAIMLLLLRKNMDAIAKITRILTIHSSHI